MPKKKKNFWYWLGQTGIGLASVAVAFSDTILGKSFPEHTWVNQMAIPIGAASKFLWDRVRYQKNILPGKVHNKVFDAIPNAFTGLRGSKFTKARIRLARFASDSDTTIGALFIDDVRYCYIIEDQYQSVKVANETRIPAGQYKLGFRTENSSMNDKYKDKYPDSHVGMIEILAIPSFTNVYFHICNDDDDTAGCPLTNNKLILYTSSMYGEDSTSAYERFYAKVAPMMQAEDVSLLIEDKDIKL